MGGGIVPVSDHAHHPVAGDGHHAQTRASSPAQPAAHVQKGEQERKKMEEAPEQRARGIDLQTYLLVCKLFIRVQRHTSGMHCCVMVANALGAYAMNLPSSQLQAAPPVCGSAGLRAR